MLRLVTFFAFDNGFSYFSTRSGLWHQLAATMPADSRILYYARTYLFRPINHQPLTASCTYPAQTPAKRAPSRPPLQSAGPLPHITATCLTFSNRLGQQDRTTTTKPRPVRTEKTISRRTGMPKILIRAPPAAVVSMAMASFMCWK